MVVIRAESPNNYGHVGFTPPMPGTKQQPQFFDSRQAAEQLRDDQRWHCPHLDYQVIEFHT